MKTDTLNLAALLVLFAGLLAGTTAIRYAILNVATGLPF